MSTPVNSHTSTRLVSPLSAPEMVQQNPSHTAVELGQYWADLTMKEGAPLKSFSLNGCTEEEFLAAYEAGKAYLPPGDDALLVYFFNAAPLFLGHFGKYPPGERALKTENTLCQYLLTHEMTKSRCVLQVLGSLNAKAGGNCRLISDHQLQVPCGDNLYLQIPLEYEKCLDFILSQLNQRDHEMFQVLTNGLNLFTPDDAEPSPGASSVCTTLMEIYRALNRKKDYWASLRLLSLLANAGYNPIDSKTVFDLPDQLSFVEKIKQFDKLLPRLRSAYKNSRFANVIEAACNRPSATRQAAVEALRVCNDAEVLAFAWQLEDEKRVDFLHEIAPTMPEEALPFALNHLIKLCKTANCPILVAAYLERLLRSPSALNANYEPVLVSLLSTYLRPLLSMETAGQLMDQLGESCAFVSDTKIISDLAGLLVREGADSALWSKFQSLLTTLVRDGKFVEEVIVVFETVARTAAAAGCFEVAIPQLGKRKLDQKQRIARAYIAAIQLQSDPIIKDRMIATLPEGWLSGQLRNEETWEAFADLLLYSCSRKDFKDPKVVHAAVQDALWLVPHLLSRDQSPHFANFEALIQRFHSRNLGEEWKPHLAGLLGRNPGNSQLLTKLIEIASKVEKRVLQECQTLQKDGQTEVVRRCMTAYRATGTFAMPKPGDASLTEQFQNALSSKKLTLALSLLQKMEGPQWELWRQFIGCLPEKPDQVLAEQAFSVWQAKHPIGDHKPEDEPYWKEAIQRLVTNVSSASPVLADFIITRMEKYAAVLGKENSEILVRSCRELGVAACWNRQTTQPAAILRGLLRFRDHADDRFFLMLANQEEQDLYEIGNRWVLERIAEPLVDVGLFKRYSLRPYFPKGSVEDQTKFLTWIKNNLTSFPAQISWTEKYRIFSVLCSACLENHNEDQKIPLFTGVGSLWDNLLATLPQAYRDNAKCAEYFHSATIAYVDAAMKNLPNKILRHNILIAINQGFLGRAAPFFSQETAFKFRFYQCFNMLSLIPFDFPDEGNRVNITLADLNDCFIHFIRYSNPELSNYVVKLLFYFCPLLNHPNPDITVTLRIILENLLSSPLITKAKAPATSIWVTVLQNLCLAILNLQPERRADAVKMVAQLFRYCTAPKLDKQIVDPSVNMLGTLFFSNPHIDLLPDEDWKVLIEGQTTRSIRRLMTILRTEIEEMALEKTFSSSLALARLICHANPGDKLLLRDLVEHCALGTGTHFNNLSGRCEPILNLRLHSQWIRAISSLSRKCKAMNTQIDRALVTSRVKMTQTLTASVCQLIVDKPSYDLYIPFLKDALTGDNDFEVTKQVHGLLTHSQVAELNDFKERLEFVLNSVKK